MLHMKLSEQEAKLLQDILTYYLSELRMEIADTDYYVMRRNLKAKEEDINRMLAALSQLVGEPLAEETIR
ncbi:MAG: hypothetical protein R2911_05555 [Caldilineaceae bacterium]